jgi:hypothetical protein
MPRQETIERYRGAVARLCLAIAGCAGAVSGCGSDGEVDGDCLQSFTCELPPGWRCQGDSVPAPATEGTGVFVSASLGDDANRGTRDQPVRTLQKALSLTERGPKRVYACAEDFTEAVTVSSDVQIWGGFDCADGWRDDRGSGRTILRSGPDSIPLQVTSHIQVNALFADLRIEAASASRPGGSSIAMLAGKTATVEVCRSELIAGNGKDGVSGQDAALFPAEAGRPGNPGLDACSKDALSGGPFVVTACGDEESIGGAGGDGYASFGDDGYDGAPIPIPNPDGFGLGGTGETVDGECRVGAQGKSGADGAPGKSGLGLGTFTESGWAGIQGEDGKDGLPGHGAGGGGGSRGGALYCGSLPKGGASGGSGGSGGCGGAGGKGGGYGGASIGLVSVDATVNIHNVRIQTSNGGQGGAGGRAQFGGRGGIGGIGGAGNGGSKPGCDGGRGGTGGNGGYGAGGLGGHSIGVAYRTGGDPAQHDMDFSVGEAGHGGPAGNGLLAAGRGGDGKQAEYAGF